MEDGLSNTWSCLPLPFDVSNMPCIVTQKKLLNYFVVILLFFEQVVFFISMTNFLLCSVHFFFIISDGFEVSTDSGYWYHFVLCCFLAITGQLQSKLKHFILSLEGNKHYRYHKTNHKEIFFYFWWTWGFFFNSPCHVLQFYIFFFQIKGITIISKSVDPPYIIHLLIYLLAPFVWLTLTLGCLASIFSDLEIVQWDWLHFLLKRHNGWEHGRTD